MKTDKLMDALKAFEVSGQDEIRGGYYTIIYRAGRNGNESHGTIYDAKDHVYSESYYSTGWESLHPSGITTAGSGSAGASNGGSGFEA
jgi:hypothetical protein